jgi:protein-disulfide isomerase
MSGDTEVNDSTRRFGWPAVLVLLGVIALAVAIVLTERSRRSGAAEGSAPANAAYGQAAPRDTIDLSTLGYSHGPDDAPITVYEFSDFGCPYCAKFALETYPELHREFVATGKVRWTYVPFVMGTFPNGDEAARAAECAGEQDEFWAMHDHLFARQREWKGSRDAASLFARYADGLSLDLAGFTSCYRENRRGRRLDLHNYVADALRVRATPSFFINGRLVEGALPIEAFREILTTLSAE